MLLLINADSQDLKEEQKPNHISSPVISSRANRSRSCYRTRYATSLPVQMYNANGMTKKKR